MTLKRLSVALAAAALLVGALFAADAQTKFFRLLVQNRQPADIPLTVKMAGSQTANAISVQNSSGTALFTVSKSGHPNILNAPTTAPVGLLQYAEVALTNANIKALRATPIELVAAPGAGRILEFVSAVLLLDAGANAITESADNLLVRYENGSGDAASQVIEATGFIDQTTDQMTYGLPTIDPIVAKAVAENKALVLHNNGDGEFAGNAANDATLRVKVAYRVHTSGW